MSSAKNKSVVVTGASRGIGEALAKGFAAEGANVVLAARSVEDLERVQKECLSVGAASATVVQTDVTDAAQVQSLVDGVIDHDGRIDVFIANAGTSYGMLTDKKYREIWTYDVDVVEQIFRVNTIGMFLCMKSALPVMKTGSSFIAIGSETARALRSGSGLYPVSKGTVDTLAAIAAQDAAEAGVRVNVLSPGGMVDTQLFGPDGMPDFLKQMHPPLTAESIVPAALWLSSDEAADVTGTFTSGRAFSAEGPAAAKPIIGR